MLTGEPTEKRPLGKPRFRSEDSKIDLKEIDASTRNWIDWTQDEDYWRAFCASGSHMSWS